MIIVENQKEFTKTIDKALEKKPKLCIGFVPTMGALHQGHLSLIEKAKAECDIVICSIFVNPTQFNRIEDLETYPRTIVEDTKLLEDVCCDYLFLPSIKDVYPDGIKAYSIDLGGLDEGMEGEFREGHFDGVCMVVERFFEMVKPTKAFFGRKDFQQLAIIRKMVAERKIDVEIIGVPIKRAANGLALSSRNGLLSDVEKQEAVFINKGLKSGLNFSLSNPKSEDIGKHINSYLKNYKLNVEYIAIVDNLTLKPVEYVSVNTTVCIVAFSGKVRLIDNMQFSDVINE